MQTPLRLSSTTQINSSELIALHARLSSFSMCFASPLRTLTTSSLNTALRAVHDLLGALPQHLNDVQSAAPRSSLFELRVALFALIDADLLSLEEGDQLAPLFRVLGVEELEEPLYQWFVQEREVFGADEDVILPQRRVAVWDRRKSQRLERGLAALFHSTRGFVLFEQLSERERIDLCGPWVRPMMRLSRRELFPRVALRALYLATSQETRASLIDQLEKCRAKVGAPLFPTYEELFHALDLPDLDRLFTHFAQSGEIEQLKPHLPRLPPEAQIAFDYAVCSLRAAS